MSVHTQSAPMLPRFAEFLTASVGEERNGMQLSVLSTLARLDMDPWQEAARLADLPMDGAAKALGAIIDRLPVGQWEPKDTSRIAARLVRLLPADPGAALEGDANVGPGWTAILPWLLLLALVAVLAVQSQ